MPKTNSSPLIGYALFLRGINVGGNKKVSMIELKKCLEVLGLSNIKTLLNSGNVIFQSSEKNSVTLTKIIATQLQKTFGFEIGTIIRTIENLQTLAKKDPFKKIQVTPATRLYITFLSEKPNKNFTIPYSSPDKNFQVLQGTDQELCSVLTVANGKTVDLMNVLDKNFGKTITTRNWNTVTRILQLAQSSFALK